MSPDIFEYLQSQNIEIVTGATKLLGACIGNDNNKCIELATEIANQHQIFFDRLQHSSMSQQVGMLLLRSCGLPRFNYLARTTEPHITRHAATILDQQIHNVLQQKSQIPFILNYSLYFL